MALNRKLIALAAGAAALTVTGTVSGMVSAAEVNLYSSRKEELLKPLLDQFTKDTGIKVNLLTGKDEQLLERLKSEGANSPADVLMTVDVGRLHKATDQGLLQAATSKVIEANVPAQYRDPENRWVGLSLRSRIVFYAKDRVKPSELSTYEDLADPKWKNRICIRGSGNIYNQSLLASLIEIHGAGKAEEWAKGMVANMARKPQGGDRDQIKAVAAGECDLAVSNTYYYGQMQTSKDEAEKGAAAAVAPFFPNQAGDGVEGRGAHMNVSGAGVTASAKNKAEAVKLIEFLTGDKAQAIYAEKNNEYPVKADAKWADLVANWGTFKADTLNVSALGTNNAEAVKIFDRVGWR